MVELNKIYNEDCLETMKRMEDKSIGLVFADPPYNLGINYDIYNDSIQQNEYIKFCSNWFYKLKRVSSKIVITPGTRNLPMWIKYIEEPKHIGCWYKLNSMTGCKFSNLNLWEPLLYYFYDNDRYKTDSFRINIGIQDNIGNHPCPKPLLLLRWIIHSFSEEAGPLLSQL